MNPDRLIRLRDVAFLVGMSRATIYRKIKLGEFPRPVGVGGQSVRWRESVLAEWMSGLK
jgi:prophage regulatory protein